MNKIRRAKGIIRFELLMTPAIGLVPLGIQQATDKIYKINQDEAVMEQP